MQGESTAVPEDNAETIIYTSLILALFKGKMGIKILKFKRKNLLGFIVTPKLTY